MDGRTDIPSNRDERTHLKSWFSQRVLDSSIGQGSVGSDSLSEPEFNEAHSFYLKRSNMCCCSCMRREVRTLNQRNRKRLSWSAVLPIVNESETYGAFNTGVSSTNLSGPGYEAFVYQDLVHRKAEVAKISTNYEAETEIPKISSKRNSYYNNLFNQSANQELPGNQGWCNCRDGLDRFQPWVFVALQRSLASNKTTNRPTYYRK